MHRTQLLLDDWQYAALKARAEREGRSISDLLRELITQQVGVPQPGASDLEPMRGIAEDKAAYGRDHDRFLYGKQRNGK
jgi:plasmid stability protein